MANIKVLTVEDWREWRAMRLKALAQAPDAFAATLAEWTGEGDTEQRWRGRLEAVALHALALTGDVAVGMISATQPRDGDVWLLSLWVDPSARGQAVGDLLVRCVAAWASDRGADRVVLGVRADNAPAIGLYRRNGFCDTGETEPADDVVERRMVLHLT